MSPSVTFRVLGPLEIIVDGLVVPVDAGKQRAVLAALLIQANRTVSVDELIDKLWDGHEPRNVRATVQKYVLRVRRILDAAGVADDVIHTEPDGYRMTVSPGQLDLERFTKLSLEWEAAVAAGDVAGGSTLLAEALGLWIAVPPLSNVPSVSLHRHEVTGLVERYLHALDQRIELDLGRGMHAELVAELTDLSCRYPHRERFWAQRMRALHRSGRQGEALAVHREIVRLLAEELGVDPGTELIAAHHEVLARPDPGREARSSGATSSGGWLPARQLPWATVGFVGREAELARITEALGKVPVVITGMAGVGKTALATRASHQVAAKFPDGQLYADLRGCAAEPPVGVSEVLERFLRALGVPPDAVPHSGEEQILAYRSLLADRRLLVVLDDVTDVAQARALMPGAPGCAVLVTSRDELAGMLVSPGACRIRVGDLTAPQAARLLAGLLGTRRVEADRPATGELIEMCGGLPLALRIAAAHLLQHRGLEMADYVHQLRSAGPATALCIHGDALASVTGAFDRSYRLLAPGHRRLLRVLGHIPTLQFTASAAAERAGITEAEAAAALEVLAGRNLLTRLPAHRYQMHGLIRGFARRHPDLQADEIGATEGVRPLTAVSAAVAAPPRQHPVRTSA